MGISFTASLFLALGIIHPVNMLFSALPEDMEGSGYDLDSSGSGDWSGQVLSGNIQDDLSSKDVFPANTGHGAKNSFHGSPVLPFDSAHWPAKDSGSGFILLENSKGFLGNKDIVAGVIAGGVSGGLIAAALVAILIYKWHKKNDGGYILGQQRG